MSQDLVTVATFFETHQAHLAKNALVAAGIEARIADETVVTMDWLLGNAIGGVKVVVRESDAERAIEVLEREVGSGRPEDDLDPEEFAEEAESAPREDEREEDSRPASAVGEAEAIPPSEVGYREQCARRLFFVAWIGTAFPPLAFYAVYLFLNAVFGEGELSSRGRFNLFVGGMVTFAGLGWCYLFIVMFNPL